MSTKKEWELLAAAERNDEAEVKRLIEEQNVRIFATNEQEQTAAHIAVKNGNLSMLKYLLGKNRDLVGRTDQKFRSVLHVAVTNGSLEIVKYLIDDFGLDIYRSEARRCGETVVHFAAAEDQLEILKYFLHEKHVDVNVKDMMGASPLFQATEKERMRIVKYLMEAGADATATDNQGQNVLFRSARIGDMAVPKYLLDERKVGIDVNAGDKYGKTVLHVAVRYNQIHFVKYIVEEKNADLHKRNWMGWTAMHEAASEGHLDVVKYLVEKGAEWDYSPKEDGRKAPIEKAKDAKVVAYLNGLRKSRFPRHVAFEPDVTRQYLSSMFEMKRAPRDRMSNRISASAFERTSLDGLEETPYDVSLSRLHSFLLIANMVSKRTKKSLAYSQGMSQYSEVRIKTDPLAVEVVEAKNF